MYGENERKKRLYFVNEYRHGIVLCALYLKTSIRLTNKHETNRKSTQKNYEASKCYQRKNVERKQDRETFPLKAITVKKVAHDNRPPDRHILFPNFRQIAPVNECGNESFVNFL